ncbi:MAG: SDR family NAD(P)-dependent oxidoreductase, partial [Verrucomicrobiota bacterium]
MAAPSTLAGLVPTAFVTGASQGLGRAFTEMLLAEGVRVWGTARSVERLADLSANPLFTAVALDLGDPAAAEDAYRGASAQAGGFHLVVNNAGYGIFADALAEDPAVWDAQIDEMLKATIRLGRLALLEMKPRGRGHLVNISSLAVEFPLPFMSGYNVVKAGLSAWSESLAVELAGSGVCVVDFRPGDYRTDFNRVATRGAGTADPRAERAWTVLGRNLDVAPPPARAAAEL